MPELPEVENFARTLHSHYAGAVLSRVVFRRDDLRFPFDKQGLTSIMRPGARVIGIYRVGKQICFEFDRGRVFASLGMSGSFVASERKEPRLHEHLTLAFRGTSSCLGYVDPRRFGFFSLQPPPDAVSPLDAAATAEVLLNLQKGGCRRRIRDVLLDQNVVAGVGNIYMCEACFAARIDPLVGLDAVPRRRLQQLANSLAQILEGAIALGGSTIATYRTFDGQRGGAQSRHQVYGRADLPCVRPRCAGVVVRRELAGRGVFLCPRCQGEGESKGVS